MGEFHRNKKEKENKWEGRDARSAKLSVQSFI